MSRLLLATALVVAALAPGCLGTPSTAQIPSSTLNEHSWRQTGHSEESLAFGMAKQITVDYRPRGGVEGLSAGVTVVSVTDVPLIDESDFIPQALEQIEQEKNVDFSERGTRSLDLTNFGSITGTEYDVRSGAVTGRALIVLPPCGDFVITVAFGALESGSGGIFGGDTGGHSYSDALDVAKDVQC